MYDNSVYRYFHPKRYIDYKYRKGPPCGYCHCDRHRGYLSVKLIKKHKCLSKNCEFFEKYSNHPYWDGLSNKKSCK